MPLTLVTGPTVEPVSLTEAKAQCRVTTSAEDAYITALISAARQKVEKDTRRALVEQTWRASFPDFPGSRILRLEKAPLISVTSVKYYDAGNVEQTLSTDYWSANTAATPGFVELEWDEVWPSTYDRSDAVNVTFKAGHGDEAADVPQALKLAVQLLVAHWFITRQPVGNPQAEIPHTYDNLVGLYEVNLP